MRLEIKAVDLFGKTHDDSTLNTHDRCVGIMMEYYRDWKMGFIASAVMTLCSLDEKNKYVLELDVLCT